ncbi:class II aldolase/adducin family protein [uncultured Microbacterium sp.]|uniref:class II aldolase/adducin family protein n=1 Tax=uncultured Microbacterium sp. TaxID=191216 RepID=UPI0035C98A59
MDDDVTLALLDAARVIAANGLSDAFGHVSTRISETALAITPVTPLGLIRPGFTPVEIRLDATELPPRAPKEAWIHVALMRDRPDIGAVCRAQPPSVAAVSALNRDLVALSGHGAVLGPIATYAASWLVRDAARAIEVETAIATYDAVILRGNGAVTCGTDLPHAVARMWLLERLADLSLQAWSAGDPVALPEPEREWWFAQAGELLPRIYDYLVKAEGDN